MSPMTKDEVQAFNMGIKQIDDEIEWLINHFKNQLNGYSLQRLYSASRAMRDAVIDGETEG